MTSRSKIVSVFVPFEVLPEGGEKKRDDLPRFLTSTEIRNYIIANRNELANWLIQWREHTEKELIDEYFAGVGTPGFRRQ